MKRTTSCKHKNVKFISCNKFYDKYLIKGLCEDCEKEVYQLSDIPVSNFKDIKLKKN